MLQPKKKKSVKKVSSTMTVKKQMTDAKTGEKSKPVTVKLEKSSLNEAFKNGGSVKKKRC